jgi:hypothetical protein
VGVAQTKGSIHGTVVDEKGAPVNQANVNVDPVDGRTRVTAIRYAETDANGHFLLAGLQMGKYRVLAKKEAAGFPEMALSFYSAGVFPTATIDTAFPVAEVRIQLGPKGGILSGSVTNGLTGAPLNASLKLTRAASSDDWMSTSVPPAYRVLLPAATEVLLEVSAPGFKTWSPGHPLLLQSGLELRLDVALQPAHDPTLHPSRFLVPEGYSGWLLLEYNVKDAEPATTVSDIKAFQFPATGVLNTSSPGPEKGADDQYFYYLPDGSLREIPQDYTNGKGLIWGQHEGSRNGVMSQFGFFVGSEEQFKKYQSQATHPGRLPSSQQ